MTLSVRGLQLDDDHVALVVSDMGLMAHPVTCQKVINIVLFIVFFCMSKINFCRAFPLCSTRAMTAGKVFMQTV